MVKSKITNLIDLMLTFVLSFIFFIVFFSYFLDGMTLIFMCSFSVSLIICALIRLRHEKSDKNKGNIDTSDKVLTQFIYNDETFAFDFTKKALQKKFNLKVITRKDYFIVGTTAVFVKLNLEVITHAQVANMYAKTRKFAKKIIVLSIKGADKEAKATIATLPPPTINIFDGNKSVRFFAWLGLLPNIDIKLDVKNKVNFKRILKSFVERKKARRYFFVATILLVWSLLVPKNLFYIVVASICLVLTLLCFIDISKLLSNKQSKTK